MSDPNYGEPVEETTPVATPVEDVVGRAQEGLAHAEAASRDAVADDDSGDLSYISAAGLEPAADEVADVGAAVPEPAVLTEPSGLTEPAAADAPTEVYAAAPAVASEPLYRGEDVSAVTPSEPVVPLVAPAPQPIFVQAPEAPRPRGNRGAAGAIGLLAAVVFGVLYLAAALGFRAIDGDVTTSNLTDEIVSALGSWWFWVPVAVFFLAFWLLGAIINRGRWGYWVVFGLLVGVVAYGGHLLGQLFQAPFWTLTASQGAELVQDQLLTPLAIAAFIFGREITIWFGAWVAARGKRVAELNYEAQREYERTLEAGPRLHQS